ncbi:MAG TPA: SpvB/TcaC N-terminal domain-containing protein, partial [Myxococcaceae bacterium]|nr:SpvB/TcaC N-terminal domain-containing protein [Myxococcaceae bacterium]
MHGFRLRFWLVLVVVLATGTVKAQGAAGQGASSSVDAYYGAFSGTVPIEVPGFHSLEPSLSLTYDSTTGNGQVGVGWKLSGFSTIERASPGKGSARYDGSDIFLLDGQELMACPAGSASPSCTTGGTHATRIEGYQRIQFDAATNTWKVWRKDGTRLIYSPLFPAYRGGASLGTYRWGASSVMDTSGNTVSFAWWCDGSPVRDCYPDSVSYGGYTVKLYREVRSDPVSFANGSDSLGRTSYRLKSILVTAPGQTPIRAYKLKYTSSGGSTRSLLASVQQYGRDVIIDAGGTITGGSSLPAMTLGWSGASTSRQIQYTGATSTSSETYWSSVVDSPTYHGKTFSTDINGDGRGDVVMMYQDVNNRTTVAYHWLSDGNRLQYAGASSTSSETYWSTVVDSPTY